MRFCGCNRVFGNEVKALAVIFSYTVTTVDDQLQVIYSDIFEFVLAYEHTSILVTCVLL